MSQFVLGLFKSKANARLSGDQESVDRPPGPNTPETRSAALPLSMDFTKRELPELANSAKASRFPSDDQDGPPASPSTVRRVNVPRRRSCSHISLAPRASRIPA